MTSSSDLSNCKSESVETKSGPFSATVDNDDDDDDVPQLSAHTLAALQQFYSEQEALRQLMEESTLSSSKPDETENGTDTSSSLFKNDLIKSFPEDWQLSQFWYDEETSKALANEILKYSDGGLVACVSCPSIFRACENASNVRLFEYDKRFRAFGSSFHFYDYKDPENIPEACVEAFSVVIADPPFLSEECLEKVAITIKKLVKNNGKIILCTGAIMEPVADRLLSLKRSSFIPKHTNNLGNEFACFANYELSLKSED